MLIEKAMIANLPCDIQSHVFDIYKANLRERYERSCNYILDMIHASCVEDAEFLIGYMRQMVQNPSTKPHFALVLTGEFAQVVASLLCKVVGGGKSVTGDSSLFGRFNGRLRDKTLVVIQSRMTDRLLGEVKGMLSSPTIVIEERYRNVVRIPSYHRIVLISQTQISDRSRRFHTVECKRVDWLKEETMSNTMPVALDGLLEYLKNTYTF